MSQVVEERWEEADSTLLFGITITVIGRSIAGEDHENAKAHDHLNAGTAEARLLNDVRWRQAGNWTHFQFSCLLAGLLQKP